MDGLDISRLNQIPHNLTMILLQLAYLPREAEMMVSGSLGLVAIWVTQPLWPIKVPRNCNVSDILK